MKPCFQEGVQDFRYVLLVFLFIFGKDDYVVKVGETGSPQEVGQGGINEPLKDGGRGGKPHGHDVIFKKPKHRGKCRFPLVAVCYPDVVESRSNVKFGVDLRSGESVNDTAS